MLAFLQVVTIVGMLGATYFVYQALGPRRATLTFTREEKRQFDGLVGQSLGNWLTASNIFATLTSLATVYVFFIGNINAFGFWVFAAVVSMWVGAFVTNHFTGKLLAQPAIRARLESDDQSAAVMLSIFADGTAAGTATAKLVKGVTLLNILAILWLEFSVFADISSRLIAPNVAWLGPALLFVCAFAVVFFTLRFGLRGFVFADLFQGPVIVLGSLALLIGAVFVIGAELANYGGRYDFGALAAQAKNVLVTTQLDLTSGLLFTFSCFFLNAFLVLVTQPHWLRLWVFREKETHLQVVSMSFTCGVWLMLIGVGILAAISVTLDGQSGANANEVVVALLRRLTEDGSPLFAAAFWLAGMAALFSSADAQIYSAVLQERFDCAQGHIQDADFARIRPIVQSAAVAALFAGGYWVVREVNVPFDQLVLVLLPSCLIIVPALIFAARGVPASPAFTWVAGVLYVVLAGLGLQPTKAGEIFSVAAPVAPLLVSLIAYYHQPKEVLHERAS